MGRLRWNRKLVGGLFIALGLVVSLVVVLVGLIGRPLPEPEEEVVANGPVETEALLKGDLKIEGARLTRRRPDGTLDWSLEAGTRIKFDAERKVAEATSVNWKLSVGEDRSWVVEAPHLLFQYETGRLEFSQGVRLYSPDRSQRFSIPRLVYRPGPRQLQGEGPVEFVYGESFLTAQRLVVDVPAQETRLAGSVRLRVRYKPQPS